MFNLDDFKRIIAESGLNMKEIAYLYGVARQTAYYWIGKGTPRPGSHTARMAETITKALLNAIANGALPLPASTSDIRRARVEKMHSKLQNLKPAPAQ